jgi:hypothetical protein
MEKKKFMVEGTQKYIAWIYITELKKEIKKQ